MIHNIQFYYEMDRVRIVWNWKLVIYLSKCHQQFFFIILDFFKWLICQYQVNLYGICMEGISREQKVIKFLNRTCLSRQLNGTSSYTYVYMNLIDQFVWKSQKHEFFNIDYGTSNSLIISFKPVVSKLLFLWSKFVVPNFF